MPFGQQGGAYLPNNAYSDITLVTTIPGDAQIGTPAGLKSGSFWLTKGSAAAIGIPAPKIGEQGTTLTFIAGTAFAHVVTASIDDGVTGGTKTKWTAAAFVGSSITLQAMPNLKWSVVAQNLGAVS